VPVAVGGTIMETKNVIINEMSLNLPSYYQQVESMPDDPADSIPFMVQTGNASCLVLAKPITMDQAIPFEQRAAIDGIRSFLQENQGIIEVNGEEGYIYSIVKTLRKPSGVQYCLTYQQFFDRDHILMVQGFFDEIGTTGMRDAVVYELSIRKGMIGSDSDPSAGWAKDPYDPLYMQGALMNLSEQEQFDDKFPGHPLSMCRELVRTIIQNRKKERSRWLFGFLKPKETKRKQQQSNGVKHQTAPKKTSMIRNSSDSYADGSSVAMESFIS
jgi:hypothetical protein